MDDQELRVRLDQCHPESFGWALQCCSGSRDMAEDVLQNVYLKILEGKARFGGKSTFKTWLFAVIRNTAAEDRRRRIFRKLLFLDTASTDREGTEHGGSDETIQRNEIQTMIEGALVVLSKRQQQVLHLVFYQGLTLEEAASVLGISVGSVRTHYDRAKSRLRLRLEESEDFNELRRARKNRTTVLSAAEAKG